MSLYPNLSRKEKFLACGVVLLLAVFVVVGYTKALAEESTAGVLVAQYNTTPTKPVITQTLPTIQTDSTVKQDPVIKLPYQDDKVTTPVMPTPTPTTTTTDEKSVNQDDTKNQQNRIRDQQNYSKDKQREITDIKRQVKTLDTSAVDALLAKFAACIQARTAEVGTQDFWNNMQECDYMTRDIEDQLNDNLRPQRDCADRSRSVNDRRRERKNLDSQVKDILRMNKGADVSVLTSTLAQIDALFTKADQAVAAKCSRDTADLLNDVQNEFNTLFQDFYNASNEARELASCPQTQKNINDRRKERKNLDSQLRDIQRMNKSADVSVLTTALAQIDALFAKADKVATGVCNRETVDMLNDIQNEFNTLFQDFYNSSNDVRQQADQGRQIEDSKRDFEKDKKPRCEKDKARELKNFERELTKYKKNSAESEDAQALYDKVKAIYDKMCVEDLAAMKAALDKGDAQTYNDVRSDFDGLDRDFWDSLNESRQGVQEKNQKTEQLKNVTRELKDWTRQLKDMKREVARLKKLYDRTAKKYADKAERKEALAAFKDYVAKADELVKTIEAGLTQAAKEAPDDPESWWMDHQQDLNDLRQDFGEMQQEIQMIGQILQTLAQAEKDIIKGTAKELAQLKRESNNDPELIGKLNDIVTRAKASLTEAWGLAISSPEEAMDVLQELQNFGQEWEETVRDWRDARDATQEEEAGGW